MVGRTQTVKNIVVPDVQSLRPENKDNTWQWQTPEPIIIEGFVYSPSQVVRVRHGPLDTRVKEYSTEEVMVTTLQIYQHPTRFSLKQAVSCVS